MSVESVFRIGFFTNRMLNASVALILISQAALVYIPSLGPVFKVVPLDLKDWAIVLAASVQPLVFMEIAKVMWRRRVRRGPG